MPGARGRHSERSIPAWAGKPRHPRRYAPSLRVYPRVGGETLGASRGGSLIGGLSPRGRGNQAGSETVVKCIGSIPAWAGKPVWRGRWRHNRRVYPRVGGETSVARTLAA